MAPRAERDTAPAIRTGSRRWFVLALFVALAVHVPALPFDPLLLTRILLHTAAPPPADTPDLDELLIPVDLDLLADAPSPIDSPAPTSTAAPPSADPAAGPGPGDATPAAPVVATDPAPARLAVTPATPKADDIYAELDKPKHATATLKDPLAIAGGPGKFGPKDPNVQVLFNGTRLRGNTAGAQLGGVLTALPDWKSFFDGTKIDPVRDTDHLLIAGPQFRQSRDVVVWMQYRVPESEMREAIDTLVKRTKGGKWLEGTAVPAAIAKAHGNKRIFALIPGKKLLVILPLKAKDQLAKVKSVRPFNATSKAGIVIALTTPRNAFAGYEDIVDVPASFKWMRMIVTPLSSGGADVTLEIGDASPEKARENAPTLEKQLGQVRTLASLATLIGAEVLPPLRVEVDRDVLRVNATVSRRGLSHILNLASTHFAKKAAADPKPNEDPKDDDEAPEKKATTAPATGSASATATPSASASATAAASSTASSPPPSAAPPSTPTTPIAPPTASVPTPTTP